MSLINLLLVLFTFLSLAALIFLFCLRLYAARNLSKEDLYKGITKAEPFFTDFKIWFEKQKLDKMKQVFLRFCQSCGSALHKIKCRARAVFNRLNGKKDINSNGCSGYWKELNGTKDDGSTEFTTNGNKDGDETPR